MSFIKKNVVYHTEECKNAYQKCTLKYYSNQNNSYHKCKHIYDECIHLTRMRVSSETPETEGRRPVDDGITCSSTT